MKLSTYISAASAALLITASLISDTITWDPPPVEDAVVKAAIHWSTNPSAPFPWPVISWVTNSNVAVVTGTNVPGMKNYYYVTLFTSLTETNGWGESPPGAVVWRPAKPKNTKVGPGSAAEND